MIRVQQEDIDREDFKNMFTEAFGYWDESSRDFIVFAMYDDDKRIAFASTYPHNLHTVYLQYIGFIKGVERKYSYFTAFIDFFHSIGVKFILGAIENGNIIAIMWALRKGFKIIGTRQATNKTLYVEVLREAS